MAIARWLLAVAGLVFLMVVVGGMEAVTATRLEYRHGGRSLRVVERMLRDPRETAVVCPCEPVTEAEIRYCVEHELARTVEDVSRRTRLGLGVCGEHGGDPDSIRFFHDVGLDYVSCSPLRVPVARLVAGQAALAK